MNFEFMAFTVGTKKLDLPFRDIDVMVWGDKDAFLTSKFFQKMRVSAIAYFRDVNIQEVGLELFLYTVECYEQAVRDVPRKLLGHLFELRSQKAITKNEFWRFLGIPTNSWHRFMCTIHKDGSVEL